MKVDSNSYYKIQECITELQNVCRELEEVACEVENSIQGLNTAKYTNGIRSSISKYEKARTKLENIK